MTRARSILPLCVTLGLAPSCTTVVWYGHSPDRLHRVRVIEKDGSQRVHWDGRPGPQFRSIGVTALTFSPNSRRLAYPAQCACAKHWFLVVDQRRGPCWSGIGEVRFSPDSRHLAYVAQRGKKWHVVRDGHVGPAVDAVFRETLRWGPGSRRLFYVAQRGATKHVVANGRLGPPFGRVGRLTLSADGRMAYLGLRSGGTRVVVGQRQGPPFERITELLFRPGPRGRVAYVARLNGRWVAVVDGRLSRAHDGVAGLTFSADGAHVAFAAQQGKRARVMLNGVAQPLHDGIRYQTLAFTAKGALLYVARDSGRYRVWFQGKAGPTYDTVTRPEVRGSGWGYIGSRGGQHDVVLNGRIHHAHLRARRVRDLVLGPAGNHYAFVLDRGRQATVVFNGRGTTFQLVLPDTLALSADGRHWACLAGDRTTQRLFISIDGKQRRPFDSAELTAAMMRRGRPQPGLMRRWVRAELARVKAPSAATPRRPVPR